MKNPIVKVVSFEKTLAKTGDALLRSIGCGNGDVTDGIMCYRDGFSSTKVKTTACQTDKTYALETIRVKVKPREQPNTDVVKTPIEPKRSLSRESVKTSSKTSDGGVAGSPCLGVREKPTPAEKTLRLTDLLYSIKAINMPETEPKRSVAWEQAWDSLKLDVMIVYCKPRNGKMLLSQVFSQIRNSKYAKISVVRDLPIVHTFTVLSTPINVRYFNDSSRVTLVLEAPDSEVLTRALSQLLLDIDRILGEDSLRISLDVVRNKHFSAYVYELLVAVNNLRSRLVLFESGLEKVRFFASPYLLPGKGDKAFPQLTDEDLGFLRAPSYINDGKMEGAYVNSALEYIHSATLADEVLRVDFRKMTEQTIYAGILNVKSVEETLFERGIFVYDNSIKTVVYGTTSPEHDSWGCAATTYEFVSFDRDEGFDTNQRYVFFSRKTKLMLNQAMAEHLKKNVDLLKLTMPEIH